MMRIIRMLEGTLTGREAFLHQSALTNMIVPGREGSVWRGYIEFWPVSTEDPKKAQRESDRLVDVPVSQLCPRPQDTKRIFKDEWRH
jgi:hypothetical protein